MTTKIVPSSVTVSYRDLVNPGWSSAHTYDTTSYRVGADDPQWKVKVRSRQNATNWLTAYISMVNVREGNLSDVSWSPYWDPPIIRGTSNVAGVFTLWGGGYPDFTLADDPSSAINEALSRFNSELSDAISPLKAGEILGELRETIRSIKDRARKMVEATLNLSRAARNFRRRHRTVPSAIKHWSGIWLEYQFGIAPLMEDISTGVMLIDDIRDEVKVVKGKGKIELASTQDFTWGMGFDGNIDVTIARRESLKTQVKVAGAINLSLYGRTQGNQLGNLNALGLNINEFIPTVWELMPYSWLVDYFSNVGDVICAPYGVHSQLSWVYQVMKTLRTLVDKSTNMNVRTLDYQFSTDVHYTPFELRLAKKTFDRSTPSTLVPSLELQLPSFGSTRWANLAAFMGQKMPRPLPRP